MMGRSIFFIIFIIIVISIVVYKNFLVVLPAIPKENVYFCNLDADCTKVQKNCCGCSMGGVMICINSKYTYAWNRDLEIRCKKPVVCPAVYLCDINYTCSCQNNNCITNKS